jgi:hypothetical protein
MDARSEPNAMWQTRQASLRPCSKRVEGIRPSGVTEILRGPETTHPSEFSFLAI